MEKWSPPGAGYASANHASGAAQTSDIEYPSTCNQASIIDYSFAVEHVLDDAGPGPDGEAPPAYRQLTIERLDGNVTAEVMRM